MRVDGSRFMFEPGDPSLISYDTSHLFYTFSFLGVFFSKNVHFFLK